MQKIVRNKCAMTCVENIHYSPLTVHLSLTIWTFLVSLKHKKILSIMLRDSFLGYYKIFFINIFVNGLLKKPYNCVPTIFKDFPSLHITMIVRDL